jgi:hypothetical protein
MSKSAFRYKLIALSPVSFLFSLLKNKTKISIENKNYKQLKVGIENIK